MQQNFIGNEYLIRCDFLNKYALKSSYSIPKINKVSVRISVKTVESSKNFLYSVFYSSYLFFGFIPYLSKTSNALKTGSITTLDSYVLTFNITNPKVIHSFFFDCFLQNCLFNHLDGKFLDNIALFRLSVENFDKLIFFFDTENLTSSSIHINLTHFSLFKNKFLALKNIIVFNRIF